MRLFFISLFLLFTPAVFCQTKFEKISASNYRITVGNTQMILSPDTTNGNVYAFASKLAKSADSAFTRQKETPEFKTYVVK